jgi:hypothetical protein
VRGLEALEIGQELDEVPERGRWATETYYHGGFISTPVDAFEASASGTGSPLNLWPTSRGRRSRERSDMSAGRVLA